MKKIIDKFNKDKRIGRPIDPNKHHRKKYTTMTDPELIKKMKIAAIQEGITTADLLEELMINYLKLKNSK